MRLETKDEVAVVRLTEDVMELGLDLSAHYRLWKLFETFGSFEEVPSVLFLAGSRGLSPERSRSTSVWAGPGRCC